MQANRKLQPLNSIDLCEKVSHTGCIHSGDNEMKQFSRGHMLFSGHAIPSRYGMSTTIF